MPPRSERPLRKVTLNLFATDCDAMARRYGHGWSEKVRDLVHEHIRHEYACLRMESDQETMSPGSWEPDDAE